MNPSLRFQTIPLFVFLLLLSAQMANAEPEQVEVECAEPVIMLVIGRLASEDALKEYGAALQKLNAYPEQQGYYFAEIRPAEVFEGVWPDNQFVLSAKFPCVEAARGFWHAEEYQAIRHMRAGAGDISVSIHPINAVPDYITGAKPERLFEQQPRQENP